MLLILFKMNGYTAFPVTPWCARRMASPVPSTRGKDAGRNSDCQRETWDINAILKVEVLH